MGEAFKRLRAKAFQHQRNEAYQRLVDKDLLKLARSNEVSREIAGRRVGVVGELDQTSPCFIRTGSDGSYEVVQGNVVIANVPIDARDVVEACRTAAPTLKGILPCRIVRVGNFGAVSFAVDPKVLTDE